MPDMRHLRFSGRQYQCRKKLPERLAKKLGKRFLVRNLGTELLSKAQRLRDRILVDIADAEAALHEGQGGPVLACAEIMAFELQRRSGNLAVDHREPVRPGTPTDWDEQNGSEQPIPLSPHLPNWQRHSPVAATTAKARVVALEWFSRFAGVSSITEVDRRLAGRYVTKLVEDETHYRFCRLST